MMRRRLVILGGLLACAGVLAVLPARASGAAPLPPRQHIQLAKLCPRTAGSPRFLVVNVSDRAELSNDRNWAPEVIDDVRISAGQKASSPALTLYEVIGGVVSGPPVTELSLQPGEWRIFEATGAPFTGPHYAHFSADYRGRVDTALSARQYCQCEDELPAEPSTTTTEPPTTTTAGSTTTTTEPPA
jgi:hypothetical protein